MCALARHSCTFAVGCHTACDVLAIGRVGSGRARLDPGRAARVMALWRTNLRPGRDTWCCVSCVFDTCTSLEDAHVRSTPHHSALVHMESGRHTCVASMVSYSPGMPGPVANWSAVNPAERVQSIPSSHHQTTHARRVFASTRLQPWLLGRGCGLELVASMSSLQVWGWLVMLVACMCCRQ